MRLCVVGSGKEEDRLSTPFLGFLVQGPIGTGVWISNTNLLYANTYGRCLS